MNKDTERDLNGQVGIAFLLLGTHMISIGTLGMLFDVVVKHSNNSYYGYVALFGLLLYVIAGVFLFTYARSFEEK